MSKRISISDSAISAAQAGDESAMAAILSDLRPYLVSLAREFAQTDAALLEELEAEASLSALTHIAGYRVGARASLVTYLRDRVRQDVRNAHFAFRSGGTMDGDTYAEYNRVAGRVHGEIRDERTYGSEEVRDGEAHARMKDALMNLGGAHAWTEERFLAAHGVAHMGPQSMEEECDDGSEFGATLVDPYAMGDPDLLVETEAQELERARRSAKKALVEELLSKLTDRQRAVIEMSFGIGMAPGEHVSDALEDAMSGTNQGSKSTSTRAKRQEQTGILTDATIATVLGIARGAVRPRRKEALDKMRALVVGVAYPSVSFATTPKGVRLLAAVAANDEGVYVRSFPGKGRTDVQVKYMNDEGEMVVVYGSQARMAELGVLEGDRQVREIPSGPAEGYTFGRLYGRVHAETVTNVYVANHTIVDAVSQPRGTAKAEEGAVTVLRADPVLPAVGADYAAPLWEVPALERTDFLGRRAQYSDN